MTPIQRVRRTGTFIAVTIVVAAVSYASSGSLPGAIGFAMLLGLLAVAFIAHFDRRNRDRLARLNLPDHDYPVRVNVEALLGADAPVAMRSCVAAIEALPNFKSFNVCDVERLALEARTRMSSWSWGEKVFATLETMADGSRLLLRSEPIVESATEDVRLNFQNVALILRHLDASVGIQRLEPPEYLAIVRGSG